MHGGIHLRGPVAGSYRPTLARMRRLLTLAGGQGTAAPAAPTAPAAPSQTVVPQRADTPAVSGDSTDTVPGAPIVNAELQVTLQQEGEAVLDAEGKPLPHRFSLVVIAEGERTLDGRELAVGGGTWRELPIPLMLDVDEHAMHGGQAVGMIDHLERVVADDGVTEIRGGGTFDLGSESGREAARLVRDQVVRWVSADTEAIEVDQILEGDGCELEDGDLPSIIAADHPCEVTLRFLEYRIMGVTIVAFPAFPRAVIVPEGAEIPAGSDGGRPAAVAAVIGTTDLPVAERDTEWDGAGAARRVFELCTDDDGAVDADCVARAFLWRDDDADPTTQAAYKLGVADVIDGRLQIVPRGVAATAGGRGVDAADIPDDDKDRIRVRICSLYDRIRDEFPDWGECPFDDEDATVRASALAVPEAPPAAWFSDPGLPGPTPLTITDEGRVFGHAALKGTCHVGRTDTCLEPPESLSGYAYFRTGAVRTAEGELVPVGQITLGGGHAPLSFGARAAADHYDNAGAAVVDVAAGDDEHGIWIAGALRPGVTPEQVRALRASSLSGDWRTIGGALELVALLCVNVPGFPVPRAVAASGVLAAFPGRRARIREGTPYALVAAAGPAPAMALPGVASGSLLDRVRALEGLVVAQGKMLDSMRAVVAPLRPIAAEQYRQRIDRAAASERN